MSSLIYGHNFQGLNLSSAVEPMLWFHGGVHNGGMSFALQI